MTTERNVVLYISMSLDGYIATKSNSIDFLSLVEHEGEDYGYQDFVDSVDTVIIGRKTYQKVIDMGFDYPHTDKEVYIITRNTKAKHNTFNFYSGDLPSLLRRLKKQSGKHIYCDGGSEIANELMKHNLIDELIISIIPVLLGDGIRLFNNGRPEHILTLVSANPFNKGLTQLHYKINKK
jgi:dihydrofolate reductase